MSNKVLCKNMTLVQFTRPLQINLNPHKERITFADCWCKNILQARCHSCRPTNSVNCQSTEGMQQCIKDMYYKYNMIN